MRRCLVKIEWTLKYSGMVEVEAESLAEAREKGYEVAREIADEREFSESDLWANYEFEDAEVTGFEAAPDDDKPNGTIKCSCGYEGLPDPGLENIWKYCPECHAVIDEEEEENTIYRKKQPDTGVE